MNRRLVAGIDNSTQSTKVLVCDAENGTVVGSGRAAHPDATEVDPEMWWRALAEAGAGQLDGVAAIGVGGSPGYLRVLYGESMLRSAVVSCGLCTPRA